MSDNSAEIPLTDVPAQARRWCKLGLPAPPRLALDAADPVRRRLLEDELAPVAAAEADVLVVDLPAGSALPPEAAFAHGLVVLADDPAVARDPDLPAVLPRQADARQITAAAAAVVAGLMVRAGGGCRPAGTVPAAPAAGSPLTPREVEVLALIARGQSNKGVARELGISAHTVKYHLEAIFAKLGVRSRAEAVTQGVRRGLLAL